MNWRLPHAHAGQLTWPTPDLRRVTGIKWVPGPVRLDPEDATGESILTLDFADGGA